jgi:hypothetical protein
MQTSFQLLQFSTQLFFYPPEMDFCPGLNDYLFSLLTFVLSILMMLLPPPKISLPSRTPLPTYRAAAGTVPVSAAVAAMVMVDLS